MIKFAKFWPINWHKLTCYKPLTAEFCIFLTGANGSGKSTMTDALDFLISTKSNQFNKAAEGNKLYDRSLLGYVRGLKSLSSDSGSRDEYYRPGATTTHLAAEFQNTNNSSKFFTIGVTLEMKDIRESNEIKITWWFSDKHHIEEFNFFVTEKNKCRVATLKELRTSSSAGTDMHLETSRTKARLLFSTKGVFNIADDNMGNDSDYRRWCKNLMSAMAYNPREFSDLNEFLRYRLAPESKPEIKLFQDVLAEMTETQSTVTSLLEQQKSLSEIMAAFDDYEKAMEEADICEKAALYAGLRHLETDRIRLQEALDQQEHKEFELKKTEDELRAEQENLKLAIHDLKNNNLNGHIKELKARLDSVKQRISHLSVQLKKYLESLSAAGEFAKNANEITEHETVKLDSLEQLRSAEENGNIYMLKSFLKSLSSANDDLLLLKSTLTERQQKIKAQIAVLKNEADTLRSSGILGGESQRNIKKAIQDAFQKAGLIDKPYFLCELLDYKDSSWGHSAEAYIGPHLYSIIVSPDNYRLAAKVYKEYAQTHPNVYGVYLVDSSYYFGKTFQCEEKSLASVFTTDNTIVESYINDAYSKVMLVDDASNPTNVNGISIDKAGMKYSHHCFSRMRPVKFLSIGAAAREQRLKECESEHLSLVKDLNDIRKRTVRCEEILKNYAENINILVVNGVSALTEVGDISSTMAERQKIESELDAYQNNPELLKLQEMESQMRDMAQKLNHAISETETAKTRTSEIRVKLRDVEAKYADFREKIYQIQQENPALYEAAVRTVSNFQQKNFRFKFQRIESEFEDRAEANKQKASLLNGKIAGLQTDHCRRFLLDYETDGADTIAEYRKNSQTLSSSAIPSAQQKLEVARTQTYQQLQENILSKMGQGPIAYHRLIKGINEVLDKIEFGGRKFHFDRLKPAPEYEDYFNMIMSTDNDVYTDQMSFANLSFDDKFSETRKKFFNELMQATPEKQQELLDYRRYCRFSVTVYSAHNKKEKNSLDKLFGSNSGSENQAPIYIILAATLCAQYNRNNKDKTNIADSDTCRIMIVDECFDKMDATNTRFMMNLLSKELGLQIIAAAPYDRYSKMANCIDSVWLMTDDNNGRTCTQFSNAAFVAELDKHQRELEKKEIERASKIREEIESQ